MKWAVFAYTIGNSWIFLEGRDVAPVPFPVIYMPGNTELMRYTLYSLILLYLLIEPFVA